MKYYKLEEGVEADLKTISRQIKKDIHQLRNIEEKQVTETHKILLFGNMIIDPSNKEHDQRKYHIEKHVQKGIPVKSV